MVDDGRPRPAGVARIDAGPAAIAFTPPCHPASLAERLALSEKNGRVLPADAIDDPEARLDRVSALMAAALD